MSAHPAPADSRSAGDSPVLRFDEVAKHYGDVVAVAGVSFEVRRGEVLGLLGPNGAGKTTLIRILMDILRPTSGRVWLFGEPFRRQHLDRIGYLPEERGLYLKLRVIDVLIYFCALKGLSRAAARERVLLWLGRVGLPEVANYRVDRLSKGMSQKVQIAATLMTVPDLCVLDEPFSGLDPVNVRLVKDLIRERRDNGLTTILSTHQMSMVEELCDRVALIHRGRLMVYGEVDAVRREHSPLEVEVESVLPVPAVAGVEEVSRRSDGRYRLRLAPGGQPAQVLAELVRAGHPIEAFESVLTPMEDVFVHVVQGVVQDLDLDAQDLASDAVSA